MDGEFILFLKQTPIDYHWGRKLRVPSEYVIHKFSSIDEALLTLYTRNIVELNGITAVKEKRTYYLEEAGIYANLQQDPLIRLKKFYNEGIDPATRIQNIDCTYTLSGHFDLVSQDIRKIFGHQINRKKFGIIDLAQYSIIDKSITSSNPNLQQLARAIMEEKFNLHASFDYSQVNFQMRNAPPIAPNAVVTNMIRTRDFNTAFKHLVLQHFTLDGRQRAIDPDIEEQLSVILRASNNKPVADLQFVMKHNAPKGIQPGLYLHFEDKQILKDLLTSRAAFNQNKSPKDDSIQLAGSSDGFIWNANAHAAVKSIMRQISTEPSKNSKTTTQRKTNNKNKRPRL